MDEVAKHTTRETGIWIVVRGKVYAVTNYLNHHPGGELTILGMAGKDCTDSWNVFHSREVSDKILPKFQIGEVKDWKETSMQKDFYGMIDRLEKEGKFITSYLWYAKKWSIQAALFLIWFIGIHYASSFLQFMFIGATMGIFWHQMAFLGHDFGHNSVTGTKRGDWPFSILITFLYGVSGAWWKRSHNVHHILTNSVQYDPDIQHLPAFAITSAIFKGVVSTYHQYTFKFGWFEKLCVSYQHYLYYPVLLVIARTNLTIQSFLLCLDMRRDRNNRLIDLVALNGFVSVQFYMWSFLPDWTTFIFFNLLAHCIAGMVHVSITLSHFGAASYEGAGYDSEDHFFRTQFATTIDVDCPTWLDWAHGGLQFQLVHHLLPRLPRHNLRYARELVIEFAKKHDILYQHMSFMDCNRLCLKVMKDVAMEARQWPNGPTDKLKTLLNAEG